MTENSNKISNRVSNVKIIEPDTEVDPDVDTNGMIIDIVPNIEAEPKTRVLRFRPQFNNIRNFLFDDPNIQIPISFKDNFFSFILFFSRSNNEMFIKLLFKERLHVKGYDIKIFDLSGNEIGSTICPSAYNCLNPHVVGINIQSINDIRIDLTIVNQYMDLNGSLQPIQYLNFRDLTGKNLNQPNKKRKGNTDKLNKKAKR